MARLVTPTAIELPGPWLVEVNQLLALDDIYDGYLSRLQEDQELAIQEQIQEQVKGYGPQNVSEETAKRFRESIEKEIRKSQRFAGRERTITVYLRGGRTLRTERFSEAINHAGTTDEIPLGLRSSLTIAPVEIVVGWGVRPYGGDELKIDVEPNTNPLSQEVYGALLNWVSDIQSPLWLQKWLKYRTAALFVLGFVFALCLYAGAAWSQDSAATYFKDEAHKLLGAGVTPANQARAVELLLAIASDYSGSPTRRLGPRYWSTLVLLVLMSLCLYFCPKVVIGIWRGKPRVKRWRIWTRTVFISIPALLLSTLGMPWILKWLGLLP